ncbi:MAG: RNA polymerase factor sigma-54 [Spongiibacteraceae bacterium]|jgi:RNA polymerase sigma-54 factor|nr:RNA polymerase factor sigma-54 [Spongiibacteraceae bacterium]
MKQSLQLKLGQQLTMTPQLQQAIKLLQLSTLDLQQEIQTILESNPMLELSEEHEDAPPSADAEPVSTPESDSDSNSERLTASTDGEEQSWQDDIPEDLPVDTHWDDIYQSSGSGSSANPDHDFDFDSRNSVAESLQDHLLWQLNLTRMSDVDRLIATAIIDAIDAKGRLTVAPEELLEGMPGTEGIELDEVMAVLHRIQQFDPPGIAGRDLRECLLIQLRQLPPATPWLQEAMLVVDRHLALLGSRDFNQLMRRTRLKEGELREVLLLIQSLDPSPGESIAPPTAEYVVPDVFVRQVRGRWTVELNPDIAPRLRINNDYAALVRRADSSADNAFLRDNLQEARWFLKSLQSRNETLLKVATEIVEHQRGFFKYGEEAMKPLVLHDIAEAVGMHESTISRVTTQKYMHTPRGIFELKYFFSSHVATESGGECSSTAIRALIRKLIAAENPRKPLSDAKITELLAEQGIVVARRTIAKYREAMVIPPSNERKRLV